MSRRHERSVAALFCCLALAAAPATATEVAVEGGARTTFLYVAPFTTPTLAVSASRPLNDAEPRGPLLEGVLRADVSVGGVSIHPYSLAPQPAMLGGTAGADAALRMAWREDGWRVFGELGPGVAFGGLPLVLGNGWAPPQLAPIGGAWLALHGGGGVAADVGPTVLSLRVTHRLGIGGLAMGGYIGAPMFFLPLVGGGTELQAGVGWRF